MSRKRNIDHLLRQREILSVDFSRRGAAICVSLCDDTATEIKEAVPRNEEIISRPSGRIILPPRLLLLIIPL
jgi:hypothetical protein